MMTIENFYTTYFKPGNICTDSRNVKPGDAFIALKGDKYDGNNYAESAIKNGAVAAIIDNISFKDILHTIWVEDSLQFLQKLATHHRNKMGFQVIGLTGSNGKTTTKELIHSVLSERFLCQSTIGNLNNHIGVPLTILSIRHDTELAIVEMGANHANEIKRLCEISNPDCGLITNIGRAHLEGFGGFEGVKRAKAELYDFLKRKSCKIYYNGSNPVLTELIGQYKPAIPYNSNNGICRGEIIANNPALKIRLIAQQGDDVIISSNLYGEYNRENLLAAACIGIDWGLSLPEIKKGIEKYFPANNRSQLIRIGTTTLILDCYNANPSSMQESIQSFSRFESVNKVLILGGMKELGTYSEEEHRKLGEIIKPYNFKEIIFIGQEFRDIKISHSKYFESIIEFKDYFRIENYSNTYILIKGSRANQLEKVLEFIQ